MTDVENSDLLLQYMRIVVRQQTGILEAVNSMQRQNDNLSAILAQELIRRHGLRTDNLNSARISRPRPFFPPNLAPSRRPVVHRRRSAIDFSNDTVFNATLNRTLNDSPVRVRASAAQVRQATRILLFRDISNSTQTICPIDRDNLQPDDNILQIIQCGHFFRDTNLRRHFRGNTLCPLCRYDIRDYIPTSDRNFSNRSPQRASNPFASRPTINTSQQTSHELQSLLGEAISNILNPDASGNVLQVEYSVNINTN